MRCIVWPEQYAQYEPFIKPDAILVLRGVVDKRPGSEEANFIVNEVIPLENLASRCARGVRLRVVEPTHGPKTLDMLREILAGYPGPCDLELTFCLADGSRVACRAGNMRVAYNPEMQARVEQLLGPGNFRLLTASPTARGNGRGKR